MVRIEWVFSFSLSLPYSLFPQAAVQKFNHVILKAQHWKLLTVPGEESRETKAKATAKASCQEPASPAVTQKNNSEAPFPSLSLPEPALWFGDGNFLTLLLLTLLPTPVLPTPGSEAVWSRKQDTLSCPSGEIEGQAEYLDSSRFGGMGKGRRTFWSEAQKFSKDCRTWILGPG